MAHGDTSPSDRDPESAHITLPTGIRMGSTVVARLGKARAMIMLRDRIAGPDTILGIVRMMNIEGHVEMTDGIADTSGSVTHLKTGANALTNPTAPAHVPIRVPAAPGGTAHRLSVRTMQGATTGHTANTTRTETIADLVAPAPGKKPPSP